MTITGCNISTKIHIHARYKTYNLLTYRHTRARAYTYIHTDIHMPMHILKLLIAVRLSCRNFVVLSCWRVCSSKVAYNTQLTYKFESCENKKIKENK